MSILSISKNRKNSKNSNNLRNPNHYAFLLLPAPSLSASPSPSCALSLPLPLLSAPSLPLLSAPSLPLLSAPSFPLLGILTYIPRWRKWWTESSTTNPNPSSPQLPSGLIPPPPLIHSSFRPAGPPVPVSSAAAPPPFSHLLFQTPGAQPPGVSMALAPTFGGGPLPQAVINFTASWCGPCRFIAPVLQSN